MLIARHALQDATDTCGYAVVVESSRLRANSALLSERAPHTASTLKSAPTWASLSCLNECSFIRSQTCLHRQIHERITGLYHQLRNRARESLSPPPPHSSAATPPRLSTANLPVDGEAWVGGGRLLHPPGCYRARFHTPTPHDSVWCARPQRWLC